MGNKQKVKWEDFLGIVSVNVARWKESCKKVGLTGKRLFPRWKNTDMMSPGKISEIKWKG